jgi:chromosome segregation ATPase
LKSSNSELSKVVEDQNQKLNALKSSLENEIKNSTEKLDKNVESDELRNELGNLNRQYDEVKSAAQRLNEQKLELEKKLERIQIDLESFNNSNLQLESELKLKRENEAKQNEYIETLKSEKDMDNIKFKEQIECLNQELNALKHVKAEIDSKLEQAELNLSESHKNELNDLRKNIQDLEVFKNSLILELENKVKSEEAAQSSLIQLKQEFDSLNVIKIDLSEKLQNASLSLNESHKNQLDNLRQQIDEAKKSFQSLLDEKTQSDNQLVALNETNRRNQEEKESRVNKIGEITDELKSLKSKYFKNGFEIIL